MTDAEIVADANHALPSGVIEDTGEAVAMIAYLIKMVAADGKLDASEMSTQIARLVELGKLVDGVVKESG